jgi:hypothetical protein
MTGAWPPASNALQGSAESERALRQQLLDCHRKFRTIQNGPKDGRRHLMP